MSALTELETSAMFAIHLKAPFLSLKFTDIKIKKLIQTKKNIKNKKKCRGKREKKGKKGKRDISK